jgi:hypothetical protein
LLLDSIRKIRAKKCEKEDEALKANGNTRNDYKRSVHSLTIPTAIDSFPFYRLSAISIPNIFLEHRPRKVEILWAVVSSVFHYVIVKQTA